jgi:dienelactone hydrolase
MAGRSNEEIPSGDTFLAAWLYRPDGGDGGEKRPLVIMGHGIGGVREMRLDAYAERFAAAGLGVLVFDYRYLGASGGQPRQLVSIKRQLEDWASAIAFARRIPWVDPSRIALWEALSAEGTCSQRRRTALSRLWCPSVRSSMAG